MGRKLIEKGVRERFVKDDTTNDSTCLICSTIVPGNHLGNLKKHLQRVHSDEFDKINQEEDPTEPTDEPPRKKAKVTVEYEKQELLDAWLDLVTVEGRPFTILDSKALRTIVEPLFKAFGLNLLTSANVGDAIRKKAEERRNQLQRLFAGKIISLKFDAASRHRRRVVCVNAQIIVNGEIVVRTLSMSQLNRSHTGEHIKEYVISVLERYNIKLEQVYSITQDNGGNMILAANMMEYLNMDLDEAEAETNENEGERTVDEGEGNNEDENHSEDDNENASEIGSENENDEGSEDEEEEEEMDLDEFTLHGLQVLRCAAHTLNLAVEDTMKYQSLKILIKNVKDWLSF